MQEILLAMLADYGLREVDGKSSNPEILEMGEELNIDIEDDSTIAWCSLAINYYAKKCGYEYTNDLAARSWLKMPEVLKPEIGDIVVLWRDDPHSWKGHVGLFISYNNNEVYILAGNQNNEINITAFPRERILGFRRLKKI